MVGIELLWTSSRVRAKRHDHRSLVTSDPLGEEETVRVLGFHRATISLSGAWPGQSPEHIRRVDPGGHPHKVHQFAGATGHVLVDIDHLHDNGLPGLARHYLGPLPRQTSGMFAGRGRSADRMVGTAQAGKRGVLRGGATGRPVTISSLPPGPGSGREKLRAVIAARFVGFPIGSSQQYGEGVTFR